MKKTNLILIVVFILGVTSCDNQDVNPLIGAWEMVSSEYTLAGGQPDTTINIKTAKRIYSNSHVATFYEYSDGRKEAYLMKYSIQGTFITLGILSGPSPEMIGFNMDGTIEIDGNTMTQKLDIDGYKTEENYQKIE